MLLDAAQQIATPQGYSIGIALLLAVWAYVGIVLNLGPGLWWQEALVAGFVTGVVVGDIPLGLSVGGTLTLLTSPVYGVRSAVSGLVAMIVPVALQGRGHKREAVVPVPFLGPLDFVSRFFCEQFINFPRYVLSGGWAKALRQARP